MFENHLTPKQNWLSPKQNPFSPSKNNLLPILTSTSSKPTFAETKATNKSIKLLQLYNATTQGRRQCQQRANQRRTNWITNHARTKCMFEILQTHEVKNKNSHAFCLAHAESIPALFFEIPTKNCSFSFPPSSATIQPSVFALLQQQFCRRLPT